MGISTLVQHISYILLKQEFFLTLFSKPTCMAIYARNTIECISIHDITVNPTEVSIAVLYEFFFLFFCCYKNSCLKYAFIWAQVEHIWNKFRHKYIVYREIPLILQSLYKTQGRGWLEASGAAYIPS